MKRLVIFDFDGTLIDSPQQEAGMQQWEQVKGQPYPHKGWWGRPESLDTNVFDIKAFPSIKKQLEQEKHAPDTDVIILTSRMEKLRPLVEEILKNNKIKVDDIILKRGGESKGDVIMNIVKYNPELKEILVYDDFMEKNAAKIAEYTDIQDDLPQDIHYHLFFVDNGKISLLESTNILLKMIHEEINELKHSDIKVLKGWGGDDGIEINGEYHSGGLIPKEDLPNTLYHVTPYKTEIANDNMLKAQKFGNGFGGGRTEGISFFGDKEEAITYYWGLALAILLSKTRTREDVEKILDWWTEKQKLRGLEGDPNQIKELFFWEFDRRPERSEFINKVESGRRWMQLVGPRYLGDKIKDPIIIGGIERLKNVNFKNMTIAVVNKNDISDDTPIITGTDRNEIRVLGDVPVANYLSS